MMVNVHFPFFFLPNNNILDINNDILDMLDNLIGSNATDTDNNQPNWWNSYGECPLLNFETETNQIRLVFEILQLTGALLYILAALREMKFLGYNMFIENLVNIKIAVAVSSLDFFSSLITFSSSVR